MKLRDLTPSLKGQILLNYEGKPTEFMVLAHDHHKQGYTTLMPVNLLDKRAFDAEEPKNPNSDRKDYGNNSWRESNLRQWLNSYERNWYTSQHQYDQAPTSSYVSSNPYAELPGFLTRFEEDIVEHLGEIENITAKPKVDGGGSYKTMDKVFPLSIKELFNESENGVTEGKHIPLFKTDDDRKSNSYYWTRTPYAGLAYSVRYVTSDGSRNYYNAYYGHHGVRPALTLPSSVLIEAVGSGKYQPIFNRPPQISGTDEDLGNVTAEFTHEYTVFDEDDDKISIVVRLNNKVIDTHNDIASGTKKVIQIDQDTLYSLPLGERNTLQIEARDEKGAIAYRNIYFTRVNTAPIIQLLTDDDLGELIKPFETKVVITDPEGDETDLTYTVNEIVLENETYKRVKVHEETKEDIELGKEISYTIPSHIFSIMQIAAYELEIKAKDSQGGISKEVIKFSRTEDEIDHYSHKLEAETMPKQVMIMPTLKGEPSNMKVTACNNCFDDNPAWEDVTEEAINMMPYDFENSSKTADKWGIQVRFQLDGKEAK